MPGETEDDKMWDEYLEKHEEDRKTRSNASLASDNPKEQKIPKRLNDVPIKPFDFENNPMDPALSHLKGRAYVFKTDQSDQALEDDYFKIREMDGICKQIATDLQVWKNPFNRFPYATHRITGVSPKSF